MAATLADVAARAGVSTATVSRVLNGNYPVSAVTRERVHRALGELDYVVNGPARALAAATSEVIGVLVNDVSDPFFSMQASGTQWEAAGADLLAVICNTAGSPPDELKYINMLLRQRVRGMVLTGGSREEPEYLRDIGKLIRKALSAGTNVVMCGRPAPPDVEVPGVAFDNEGGARALTKHVIAMGHRRIAYVAGPSGNSTTTARLTGHRLALAEHDLPEHALLHGNFSRSSGFDAALELLRTAPDSTAIIAGNDLMALGVIAALRQRGVRVPEEISVAGFDDLPAAVDVVPSLTTVRLPLEQGARRAGRIAAGIEQPATPGARIWMPAELLVRESVAAPTHPSCVFLPPPTGKNTHDEDSGPPGRAGFPCDGEGACGFIVARSVAPVVDASQHAQLRPGPPRAAGTTGSWRLPARDARVLPELTTDIPAPRAVDRVGQRVSPFAGFSSRVFTITASTCSSVIVRAAPGRGSSGRPSSRSRTNRPRHVVTVCGRTPNLAATSLFVAPSAHASTILDRNASACDVLARRVHRVRRTSVSRSTSDGTSSASGRPVRAIAEPCSTDQRLRALVVECRLGLSSSE